MEANKIIKKVDRIVKYFILIYGILGFVLNFLSYKYLENVKLKYNGAN